MGFPIKTLATVLASAALFNSVNGEHIGMSESSFWDGDGKNPLKLLVNESVRGISDLTAIERGITIGPGAATKSLQGEIKRQAVYAGDVERDTVVISAASLMPGEKYHCSLPLRIEGDVKDVEISASRQFTVNGNVTNSTLRTRHVPITMESGPYKPPYDPSLVGTGAYKSGGYAQWSSSSVFPGQSTLTVS